MTLDTGLSEDLADRAKSPPQNRETWIRGSQGAGGGDGIRITIKRDQPPRGAKARKDGATVTATTEGPVNIEAIRIHHQCRHTLLQQDRFMH